MFGRICPRQLLFRFIGNIQEKTHSKDELCYSGAGNGRWCGGEPLNQNFKRWACMGNMLGHCNSFFADFYKSLQFP